MILQCDQCNTKFRLDDSKLKPGGVKVRCSKCRHVFVAGAEQRAEESDFDALLSGLGAPTPAQAAAPPSAQAGEEASLPESGAESAASQQDDAFGFDVAPESEVKAGSAPAGAEAAVSGDFDFGDINVETGMPAGQEAPLPAAGEFGEIEFNEEPVAAAPRTPAAPDLDFGELSFDEPPAATTEPAPAAADSSLDFGDFSFEEPAPAGKEEAAPPVADAMAFGELSFEESAPQAKEERGAAAQPAEDAFDFGEFSFDENPAPAQEVPAETPAVDFGEFSFEETPAAAKEEAAPAETDAVEFGDFSFEEPAASQNEEPAPAAGDSFDFGDFSFEETTAPAQAQSSEPEPTSFSFTEEAVAAAPVTPDYQNEEGEVPGEMAAPARQGGEQGVHPPGTRNSASAISPSRKRPRRLPPATRMPHRQRPPPLDWLALRQRWPRPRRPRRRLVPPSPPGGNPPNRPLTSASATSRSPLPFRSKASRRNSRRCPSPPGARGTPPSPSRSSRSPLLWCWR
ncbi:zinc-ribbon domain-containing protein [Geomonas subterranea]|uniref:zinc-ribbon domain-containing protein n=1 Tax=Geomonas subterranea TaxID=2847989 RepID=UPI001EF0A7BD|nr:zinc-ribbon domain-containing protein [Geomonas subterranea]